MENASKALLIAGAILLAILIIAIGMYIYNSAQTTIQDAMISMSTQEIEAFNNQFESYKGKQKGSQINSLIGKLIGNASTYKDEPGKVPTVWCPQIGVRNYLGPKVSILKENKSIASRPLVGEILSDPSEIYPAEYHKVIDDDLQNYTNGLTYLKNHIENKHEYYVSFGFDAKTGILSHIYIGYRSDTFFWNSPLDDGLR